MNNFFNAINNDECRLYFTKRCDNPFERLYYAHMVMRKDAYVYPTNTLNLFITQDDFNGVPDGNNLAINPGTVFYYYDHGSDTKNDYATVVNPIDETEYQLDDDGNIVYEDGKPVLVPKYKSYDRGDYYTIINVDGDERRIFKT